MFLAVLRLYIPLVLQCAAAAQTVTNDREACKQRLEQLEGT